MKSISKKFEVAVFAAVLAVGMMGCSQDAGGDAYTPKYQVGDFVLKDGKRKSKDETPESGTVAAVIVRADTSTKPALGVGIVHSKNHLAWSIDGAVGSGINIVALQGDENSGYMDGGDSWAKVKAACNDAKEHPEYYPAFNFSLTYAADNSLTGALATGWYLPTIAELKTISINNKNNEDVIEASLTKAGGDTFGTKLYWSCSQYPSEYFKARDICLYNGNASYYFKIYVSNNVCSVRTFN